MPRDFLLVGGIGVVAGLGLFITVFGMVFAGSLAGAICAVFGYAIVAALLARWRSVPRWLPAAALITPAAPFAFQFAVALLLEEGIIASLIWPAFTIVAFGAGWCGAHFGGRMRQVRDSP